MCIRDRPCRQPLFLKDLLQRFTGILNVLAQQFAGSRRVALTAEIQDLVMFLIGAIHAVSQVQLEARISFTTVVDVADNSHETRLIGARIEDRVELPVKAPPRGEVILPLQRSWQPAKHLVRWKIYYIAYYIQGPSLAFHSAGQKMLSRYRANRAIRMMGSSGPCIIAERWPRKCVR